MRKILFLICLFVNVGFIVAQDFIPLWQTGVLPNSKGLILKDSIANERVFQVAIPGMYAFRPSQAENQRAAVLIIPGGGYARLAYEVSGFQLAKWFNTFGVTAFVLFHRLPQSPDVISSYKAPLEDAQRAIRYIRAHATEFDVDTNKVGVMGSSAGAHLSACLSTFSEDWGKAGDQIDAFSFVPDFSILISPVISMREFAHKGSRDNLLGKDAPEELIHLFSCDERVTENTPPAFLIHATNDKSVSPMNSIFYYAALKKNNVSKSTLHIYPEGGHNISLRSNPGTTDSWPLLVEGWLKELQILQPDR